jgi:hypothetical protein
MIPVLIPNASNPIFPKRAIVIYSNPTPLELELIYGFLD